MTKRSDLRNSLFYRDNAATIDEMVAAGDDEILILIESHIDRKMSVKDLIEGKASFEAIAEARTLKVRAKEKVYARILAFQQSKLAA